MSIVIVPDPILLEPAKTVQKIDKKILEIIDGMKKTLQETAKPRGIGLAAPQVGQPWQIFLTQPTPAAKIQVFINPQITWRSEELTNGVPREDNKLEGCLSIPKVWGLVKRHQALKIKYLTPDGKTHHQKFSGLIATIIQHEMDHLNGKLFSARVLEQQGKFYKIKKDPENKEILEEIELS